MAFFAVFVLLFFLAATVDVPLERLADPSDSTYVPRPECTSSFSSRCSSSSRGPGKWSGP